MRKRKTPDDKPRKRRGPPLIGSERRKVSSIRIEPSLERYAIEQWGGLSTAVHELLSEHRALRGPLEHRCSNKSPQQRR